MKNLTIITGLLIFVLTQHALAGTTDEVSFFAKIHSVGQDVNVVRTNEGDTIASVLGTKQLKQDVAKLLPGDEALLKGYITYRAASIDGHTKLTPLFIIESISPVSLHRLGDSRRMNTNDMAVLKRPTPLGYSPLTIPVTTEVASAITLTTSMLLMQNLTASASQPNTKQQINTGLFLFSGALATGYFVYEQLKGSLKKEY